MSGVSRSSTCRAVLRRVRYDLVRPGRRRDRRNGAQLDRRGRCGDRGVVAEPARGRRFRVAPADTGPRLEDLPHVRSRHQLGAHRGDGRAVPDACGTLRPDLRIDRIRRRSVRGRRWVHRQATGTSPTLDAGDHRRDPLLRRGRDGVAHRDDQDFAVEPVRHRAIPDPHDRCQAARNVGGTAPCRDSGARAGARARPQAQRHPAGQGNADGDPAQSRGSRERQTHIRAATRNNDDDRAQTAGFRTTAPEETTPGQGPAALRTTRDRVAQRAAGAGRRKQADVA